MSPRSILRIAALVTMALAVTGPVGAQSIQPRARGDSSATIGWTLVDKGDQPYGNNWHSSLTGGLSGGWYWTDHLKTEIDFVAGKEAHAYGSRRIEYQGIPAFATVEMHFSRRTLGIGQHYQFFRNAWFHPHLGAGAVLMWEDIEEFIQPIILYEPNRPPRTVQPARIVGPRTERTVKPFVAGGFKGYVTQRGFFRMDLRVAFDKGVDETLLRLGFGIDF